MPARIVTCEELAKLFHVLGHPHRVRIIEELNSAPTDVQSLQSILGVSQSRVSQHLAQLKAIPLVTEQRKGRHVIYSLTEDRIALWVLEGLSFIEHQFTDRSSLTKEFTKARKLWRIPPDPLLRAKRKGAS